jgi:two-component system, sensor histidine kinase PdtaS
LPPLLILIYLIPMRIVVFIFLLIPFVSKSQLLNFKRPKPYLQVFVETDEFGPDYLDQLEKSIPLAGTDTLKLQLLNDLGYYYHTRNLSKALGFIEQGLSLATVLKDTLWEGRLQISQGAILLRMEKLDQAEKILRDAIKKVPETDLWLLFTNLGYVYERRGMLGDASDYAIKTLRLGEKLQQPKAQAMAYSDLSNLLWKQSKFDKGLEYGLKSIALFESIGINDLDYDFTLYIVGNNYLDLKKYPQALDYFNRSIKMGEQYGFYNNLSDVYISIADLYTYQGNYNRAEEAGLNAVKYAELLENNFMQMRSWLSLGRMHNKQKKFTAAVDDLQKCISIASADFGDKYFLHKAYEELSKAYAGQNLYDKAYSAFQQHDQLEDELFTIDADQRIAKIETEFELEKKENTIAFQQTKLKQQKNIQVLGIILGSLLLLFLLFLYRTYLRNKRTNVLLAKQNKEKEFLLKEIHHRVKNNLEVVSSLLSLQSGQSNSKEVQDLMQENQNRVQSMSMIHQKLYQGDNLATIEMKDYFMNLGNYTLDVFNAREKISIDYNMDKLEIDVDIAVPIGLIVNELLTNAMKYAFPDNRNGRISIRLFRDQQKLHLQVSDNGIGKSTSYSLHESGFGTKLVELLTMQLDGTMTQKISGGTNILFEFQLPKAA